MPAFSAAGREWLLSLDAPKSLAVKQECGVTLAVRPNEPFDIRAITEDPERLPDVLWVLVRQQAAAASIDRNVFVESIVGDVAGLAGQALAEAIVNFIPSHARRETLRAALMQDREAESAGLEITRKRLPELGPAAKAKVQAEVNRVIDATLAQLNAVTALPENWEPRPTDAPGAN